MCKSKFSTTMVKQEQQKGPIKAGKIKKKIAKWWKHKMAVHPKSETSLKQYKGEWNRHWERMEKLNKT